VTYDCVTASTRPDLDEESATAFRERWPEFIFHDPVSRRYVARVSQYFPAYEILLLDEGRVAAGGWGVPFAYSGDTADLPDGYDGALVRAVDGHETGKPPSAFSFMAAAVHRDYDKQGLAEQVLRQLIKRACSAGLGHIFAPIRPTWKSKYPTVPMERYATWSRPDGLSIDPWIRTHQRMGARIVRPAPRSMVIPGTVREWETWADMPFPETGDYVVPDALNLLHVDRENDFAVYEEENLWMEHDASVVS
jgi:GNAT superfamily N-acetyltransferase